MFYANVDNDHLREVLNNLVENAIKYTPSGDVIVDVTGDNDHVRVSIKDSGIGIPREDIPHLFQKFYRVDNTATREIGGTGLGLYLCRRLAEVMGGRIWVESEFKKGSTFYLELSRTDRDTAMRLIDAAIEADNNGSAITPIHAVPAAYQQTPPLVATDDQDTVPPAAAPVALQSHQISINPTADQSMPPSTPAAAEPPTLEAIEQNPVAYTSMRTQSSIQIPVRQDETINKT